MDYTDVCEAIIQEMEDVVGAVALTQARNADIPVDDAGNVTETCDKTDVDALLEQYYSIMKRGVTPHARKAVKKLYRRDKSVADLDLPEEIIPKEIRANRFASSL